MRGLSPRPPLAQFGSEMLRRDITRSQERRMEGPREQTYQAVSCRQHAAAPEESDHGTPRGRRWGEP